MIDLSKNLTTMFMYRIGHQSITRDTVVRAGIEIVTGRDVIRVGA